jgi:hypothetical protein
VIDRRLGDQAMTDQFAKVAGPLKPRAHCCAHSISPDAAAAQRRRRS